MARPSKFSPDQILDAVTDELIAVGPGSLSVSAVAGRIGAPSGSIYHRFGSRDVLVATLWLRTIERFQAALAPTLDIDDPRAAVAAMASGIVDWARSHPLDAQVLLLHRACDLLHDGWPPELVERNRAQSFRAREMVEALCGRLGATTEAQRRRVSFAAIDIGYAAVRSHLSRGEPVPAEVDDIVADAVAGVLAGFVTHQEES